MSRGRPTRTKNLSDRQERKARHAAVHNAAKMIQNVFEDGARGDKEAYGHGIRLLSTIHDVMQPAKDESKGGARPFGPRFIRAPQTSSESQAPSPADEPGSVVDREGNVYVDGDE